MKLIIVLFLSLFIVSNVEAKFGGSRSSFSSSPSRSSFGGSRSTSSPVTISRPVRRDVYNHTTVVHHTTYTNGGSNGLVTGMVLGSVLSRPQQPQVVYVNSDNGDSGMRANVTYDSGFNWLVGIAIFVVVIALVSAVVM